MASKRSTVNDGLNNRIEFYATTHFHPVWQLIQQIRPLRVATNRALINRAVLKMPTRPDPLSTMADYTSWESLTDRTFSGRHLQSSSRSDDPALNLVADLFRRGEEAQQCPKSTLLFACFAQWFTDGFLRTDQRNFKKNTSNHEIDLCQLYGLNSTVTHLLRGKHERGLLASDESDPALPPRLCADGRIKPEYVEKLTPVRFASADPEHLHSLFAMGGDRTNSNVGFAAMNLLFFREHNRIATELAKLDVPWNKDDERLFQTARNILTVMLIKIVIGEYINHIAPFHFKFFMDSSGLSRATWNRQNRMAVEFNLLYRWHCLVPDTIRVGDTTYKTQDVLYNNEPLLARGLGPLFEDFSNQPACRIGLFNTADALLDVEQKSIKQARDLGLAPYNDYRAACGFPRVTDFDQISSDQDVRDGLRKLYEDVDNIEFYVGLFAEDRKPNSVLPGLMGRMVAVDALSQALTNPLLAPRVYNETTFTPLGMSMIEETNCLSDILHRNLHDRSQSYSVTMTRKDWRPGN